MTDISARLRAMADIIDADVGANTDELIQVLRDGADALVAARGTDAALSTPVGG